MHFLCILAALCLVTAWFGSPVLTLDCNDLKYKKSCDECIQCGGNWCKNISEPKRCIGLTDNGDDWCRGNNRDKIDFVPANQLQGAVFNPKEQEMLAYIDSKKDTEIKIDTDYHQYIRTAKAKVVYMLQTSRKPKVDISYYSKSIGVTTQVQHGFCSPTSKAIETVTVEVSMEGVDEKAILIYRVPCRCGCSAEAESKAQECSKYGSLVCGACLCDPGRHGERCECGEPSSSCINDSIPETKRCSGNGRCDVKCKMCICNEDLVTPGTEHFDPENNCKDIASTVKDFFDCVHHPCGSCDYDMAFQKWNPSLLDVRDGDRKVWTNFTVDGSPFWASRSNGKIHVMRKPQC